MVSFVCDVCQTTMKKAKVAQHLYSCRQAYFSCVDCGGGFDGESIKAHSVCISEAEKHQGSMYKGQKRGPAVTQAATPAKHYLDSTDEEDNTPAVKEQPQKKAKTEAKPAAAAATPVKSPKATPTSGPFDFTSTLKSTIAKKGNSISLKKLRKAMIKASGGEKDQVTKQLMDVLMENSSEVRISFGKAEADE
jgi:cell growth-regulating nucleolar protein